MNMVMLSVQKHAKDSPNTPGYLRFVNSARFMSPVTNPANKPPFCQIPALNHLLVNTKIRQFAARTVVSARKGRKVPGESKGPLKTIKCGKTAKQ